MKKYLFTILFLFMPAAGYAEQPSQLYFYQFHLYYSGGKLTTDYEYSKPYDLLAGNPDITLGTAYGTVLSVSGKYIADFQFTLNEGTNTVTLPYYPSAGSVTFFGSSADVSPLSVSVAENATCNENNACEPQAGETPSLCPLDCGQPATPSPAPVPAPEQANGSGGPFSGFPSSWVLLVGIIFLLGLSSGIYLFIRKRSSNNG